MSEALTVSWPMKAAGLAISSPLVWSPECGFGYCLEPDIWAICLYKREQDAIAEKFEERADKGTTDALVSACFGVCSAWKAASRLLLAGLAAATHNATEARELRDSSTIGARDGC